MARGKEVDILSARGGKNPQNKKPCSRTEIFPLTIPEVVAVPVQYFLLVVSDIYLSLSLALFTRTHTHIYLLTCVRVLVYMFILNLVGK